MQDLSFLAVAPEVALGVGVLAVLLVEVMVRPPARIWGWLAGSSLAAATLLAGIQWAEVRGDGPALHYSDMIALDGFSAFGGLIIFPLTGLGLMGAWALASRLGRRGAEFVSLVLLAAMGMHLMAAAANLVMLFLALETASISLYVLAGFTRERVDADEAALKYFLLGAFASAVFLYGIALVFAATGTTSMYGAQSFLANNVLLRPGVLLAGIALMLVGLGFKVSSAPFHLWAPDVYQGAPGGVTGFLAAGAKVAGFAAMARVLVVPLEAYIDDWAPAVAALAALSVVVGTLLAIAQSDVKRMLAYSSVAHAGFILTALVAGQDGVGDMWFYVGTYAFQVVGAFTVAAVVAGSASGRSPLTDYSGLADRQPFLSGVLSLMMLAMGGIPLTAGFAGKVAVFRAAIDADYLWLVIVGLVATVAGLFFYLRVIVLMYMQAPVFAEGPGAALARPLASVTARLVLLVTSAVTVILGIVPWPLLDVVRDALPL
ncbi:MAG: NADH-quinone oxidoreductase subunit N [Acidimicrobiia bacterium]